MKHDKDVISNWDEFVSKIHEHKTKLTVESMGDFDSTVNKLMNMAIDQAIIELKGEYGEDYMDYLSSKNAVADKAMEVIRYSVNFLDLVELVDSRNL